MSDTAQATDVQLSVIALRAGGELARAAFQGEALRIGRGPDNDLVVDDNAFSRAHARLERHGPEHFLLRDLQSKNGLTVGGRRVTGWSVRGGEDVQVGPVTLRFELTLPPPETEEEAARKLSTTVSLTPGQQRQLQEATVQARAWLRAARDPGVAILIEADTLTFGADPAADVAIPGFLTPRWCAILTRSPAGFELHDVAERPGRVAVDGIQARGAVSVRSTQKLVIHGAEFTLFEGVPPADLRPKTAVQLQQRAEASGPAAGRAHGRSRAPLWALSLLVGLWALALVGFFVYVAYQISQTFAT